MKRKTKSTLTKVIAIILGVALLGGCVSLISNFANKNYVEVNPTYKIGSLNSEGGYVEDEGSMYSEHFECRGIKITPTFDSKVKYRVAFYEEDGTFISMTTEATKKTQPEVPENAMYARVLITPKDDEDGKISILEKFDYANDITISVLKDGVEDPYEYTLIKSNEFTLQEGTVYGTNGQATTSSDYDTYSYTVKADGFVYWDSADSYSIIVISRADGSFERYKFEDNTANKGIENAIAVSKGDIVRLCLWEGEDVDIYHGVLAD